MSTTRFFRLLAALALALRHPGAACGTASPNTWPANAPWSICAPSRAGTGRSASSRRRRSPPSSAAGAAAMHPPGTPPYHFLALSSGGLNGAFGVGVLKGWSESGTRPAIRRRHRHQRRRPDVHLRLPRPPVRRPARRDSSSASAGATSCAAGPSSASSRGSFAVRLPAAGPARSREVITPQILCEVAAAHRAGRRLYVATTNLDTESLKIWDMGAIASRNTPDSAALYRQIVLASSSVPLAFPPVKIHIDIDGNPYDELHVDGAVCDEVIFRSCMVGDLNRDQGRARRDGPPRLDAARHQQRQAVPAARLREGASSRSSRRRPIASSTTSRATNCTASTWPAS